MFNYMSREHPESIQGMTPPGQHAPQITRADQHTPTLPVAAECNVDDMNTDSEFETDLAYQSFFFLAS